MQVKAASTPDARCTRVVRSKLRRSPADVWLCESGPASVRHPACNPHYALQRFAARYDSALQVVPTLGKVDPVILASNRNMLSSWFVVAVVKELLPDGVFSTVVPMEAVAAAVVKDATNDTRGRGCVVSAEIKQCYDSISIVIPAFLHSLGLGHIGLAKAIVCHQLRADIEVWCRVSSTSIGLRT